VGAICLAFALTAAAQLHLDRRRRRQQLVHLRQLERHRTRQRRHECPDLRGNHQPDTNDDLATFTASSITFNAGAGASHWAAVQQHRHLEWGHQRLQPALETISLGLALSAGNHNFGVASTGTLTISGDLTGAGGITASNSGTVILSAPTATNTGATIANVGGGTLVAASTTPLATPAA